MHIHVWSITYCCYYKRQQFVAEFSVIRVHLLLLHHFRYHWNMVTSLPRKLV